MNDLILKTKNLNFQYKNQDIENSAKIPWVEICKKINIEIPKEKIIGIAGKSGCGKTTLAKVLVNYHQLSTAYAPDKNYKISGDIYFYNNNRKYNIMEKEYQLLKPPPIQMVFQDPRTSLNMKMRLKNQLIESIKLNPENAEDNFFAIMKKMIMISKKFKIYDQVKNNATPQNLSGGQRRRFGLAKIVCSKPKLILADEPVASLDVSIKQDVMNQLYKLKDEGISIVVISHDISLLRDKTDYIYVMDHGSVVEKWVKEKQPKEKETKALNDDSEYVNRFVNEIKI